ncbi:hypothetical protein SARC_14657 [Sphaeroforma arctica JP610]|uniref:ubiquitinyl hydrolase 1 n=1 Tax=Sphaeroforma arctica JP610 TaxID=667725 RepID=A0A0L0F9J7_9EUKA|nr:hypothetical protein SARC_14657 [Sphaeroforma arctica JP610]KNC72783.1 hypothetical protein SARC_14657 [Sphaeroforma arctica JP610]|eukprot:XP_014146685.1 hypothetical protein SARC_14657 [Sphaeroforma arctica JP610]
MNPQVQGIIVNVRGNGAISFSNHWFCIKEINGIYYNLDSKFSKPRQFTDTPETPMWITST